MTKAFFFLSKEKLLLKGMEKNFYNTRILNIMKRKIF